MELGPDYLGKDRVLLLYLTANFPYEPPRAHVTPTAYQEWPHGEPSGRLCLWPDGQPPDCSNPAALVEDYFNRIGQLLKLIRPGADPELRRQEFQDEWLSYWIPANKDKIFASRSYLITAPPASITPLYHQTMIRAGTARNEKGRIRTPGGFWNLITLLSSDVDEIKKWGGDLVEVSRISEGASGLYIPLSRITTPAMPESVPALRAWLQDCGGPEALAAVDKALQGARASNRRLFLLLGLQGTNGTAVAGLTVEVKAPSSPSGGRGRRAGGRLAQPVGVVRALSVARADRAWNRDRGVDPSTAALEGKHVVVVGCGMLGSPIVEGLVRAGVGRLTLIDPDEFDAANIGRHVLGASYLGQDKAVALAHHIRSSVPTTTITPISEDVVTQGKCDIFGPGIDLVICTTADWRSENFLMSERAKRGAPGTLIICWLEPYAVAGHALVSTVATEPLTTLFSPSGDFLKPCVDWPGGLVAHRLPACQAAFQPAGMAAAMPAIAMCTSAALDNLLQRRAGSAHMTWCTDPQTVQAVGGDVSALQQNWPALAVSERLLFP